MMSGSDCGRRDFSESTYAACPGVATTLTGAARAEEVRQNVTGHAEPIDQELLRAVRAILQPVLNQTWPSGRPENNEASFARVVS